MSAPEGWLGCAFLLHRLPGHLLRAEGVAVAVSAVIACLGVFAVKAVLAVAPYARRLALRPAKP